MGFQVAHIRRASRRDRMLVALAHALLCLLEAASERRGLDDHLKVNTSKQRTHSLYRQGLYWYGCIATMRESLLRPLMESYDSIAREHA